MTLLSIVQGAAVRLSLPTVSSVVANSDPQVQLLLRAAQEEGKSLAGRCDWQELTKEYTFTTVAAAQQTGSIASDLARIIPDTMFNRTSRRWLYGPIDPSQWQRIQATLVTMVNPAFRVRGNYVLITPTPGAGDTIAYEYISTKWCQDASNTTQETWLADTDTGILNEEAMMLGTVVRFKRDKGFDFTNDNIAYERYVADLILRNGVRPRVSMDRGFIERTPAPPQVPDTLVY